MKKIMTVLLCVALMTGIALAEAPVGMPNPMVSVVDDDEFERVLHIDVDADELPGENREMYIIADQLGQISFTQPNVDGEDVEWTLRFTSDDELASTVEGFSGVYDAAMTEPETREVPWHDDADDPEISISLTFIEAPTEGCDIYRWDTRDAYFVLTINGTYSQMQFAETMDRVFEACID